MRQLVMAFRNADHAVLLVAPLPREHEGGDARDVGLERHDQEIAHQTEMLTQIGRHSRRHPHRPVAFHGAPAAVLVERFRSVHAGRHVARARRPEEVVGALVVPGVPRGERRRRPDRHLRRVRPREHHLLVGADRRGGATGRRHRRAAAAMGREGGGVLSHARAVVARSVDGEGHVQGIDFDGGSRR